MSDEHEISLRRRLSLLFDDDAPETLAVHVFNALLAALIIVNVSAVILESVNSINARYAGLFLLIERGATAVFAVEYVLRVWTAVDYRSGRFRAPFWGRLKYMRGFFPLIDLIAVLPAVLGFFGAADLRVLRLLRLLRMLKLTRHSHVFGLLWSVLRQEARAIAALVFVLCLTLTVSGALMYMIEGDEQPHVFGSIPAAMWWAIETVTTVGYGDMVPTTLAGRVLAGIISIVGIGTLALFSGLITAGYLNLLKLRRHAKESGQMNENDRPAICPHCGNVLRSIPQAPRAAPVAQRSSIPSPQP